MKKTILAAFAVLATVTLAAQPFTTVVTPLEGEQWWGGVINQGHLQPYADFNASRQHLLDDSKGFDASAKPYDLASMCSGGATMPLFVSSAGRYIWSERPFRFSWKDGAVTIVSDYEKVEVVQAGKTLKEAYLEASRTHFAFDGRMPEKDMFTKPQFNAWIEMAIFGLTQQVCENYVDGLAASGFPCGVVMIDGGWMRQHGTLRFNEDVFPDPVHLFDKIHGNGWKGMLWMAYFISADNRAEYLDYRVSHPRKEPLMVRSKERPDEECIVHWWSGKSVTMDLTDPRIFNIFTGRLKDFREKYHIDGFKFDGGNPDYFRGNGLFSQPWMEGCDFSHAYNLLGLEFPYHEFRSGFKTGGLPIIQRLHDVDHSWENLESVIYCIQAAGLMGYPYTFGDMVGGGLSGAFRPGKPFSHKLVVRSCEAQALMPMIQFSVAPWRVLTKEECDICRRYAELHVQFAPYIMEQVEHASKTGEPIVRTMEYEFPGQGFARRMPQYMFGPRYLVAPVVTDDDCVTVELPAGRWKDDLGRVHKGPKVLKLENVPLDRLPYYERLDK